MEEACNVHPVYITIIGVYPIGEKIVTVDFGHGIEIAGGRLPRATLKKSFSVLMTQN